MKRYHNVYSKYKKNNFNNTYDMYLTVKESNIIINEIKMIGNNKISNNKILSMFSLKKNEELDIIKPIKKLKQLMRLNFLNILIMIYRIKVPIHLILMLTILKKSINYQVYCGIIIILIEYKIDIFNKPLKDLRFKIFFYIG